MDIFYFMVILLAYGVKVLSSENQKVACTNRHENLTIDLSNKGISNV